MLGGGSERAQSDTPTPPLLVPAEGSTVVQRVLTKLRFLRMVGQFMVDGLTQWLDACTQEHTDMSTVLRLERYVLTQCLATVSRGGVRRQHRRGV